MIGKPTAARNLDQRCPLGASPQSTREGRLDGHRRFSMRLGRALVDIELRITEIQIMKTQ
jgi:hypothetical protein